MYDSLSADYDRFVNWPARLAVELPFPEKELSAAGARSVLDAACGTGRHAIGLARRGYLLSAADPSAGMIAQARANAAEAKQRVRFEQAGFGGLASVFGTAAFNALICLGNSLPHVQNPPGLIAVLKDFSACLKAGGLLILQNRIFNRALAAHERWIEPQSHTEEGREWLFVRFYDFEADGSISFHILRLSRGSGGGWNQDISSARLWPLKEGDLAETLRGAGIENRKRFGSARGEPFERNASPDLILVSSKKT